MMAQVKVRSFASWVLVLDSWLLQNNFSNVWDILLLFQISVCHCCNFSTSFDASESCWQTASTSLQFRRPCRTVITIFGVLPTAKGGKMQIMTLKPQSLKTKSNKKYVRQKFARIHIQHILSPSSQIKRPFVERVSCPPIMSVYKKNSKHKILTFFVCSFLI